MKRNNASKFVLAAVLMVGIENKMSEWSLK